MAQLHSTKSAAHYLGVSEASVRRWSDAGLLPVKRHGRRGTRRFAEADLRRFAATLAGPATTAPLGGVGIEVHDHFATFYDSDSARMRLSLPFLREGLAAGNQCFLIASAPLAAEYLEALGVDGDSRGRLVTRAGVGASAGDAIASWKALWHEALSNGCTAIRVVGEMATYEGFADVGEMLDYEVAYDSICKRFPVLTLCQYDVRHFDGRATLGALQAHPDLFPGRIGDFLF